MKQVIKGLCKISVFTLSLFFVSLQASASDKKLCLDQEGFIYPMIQQESCDASSDQEITIAEYRHIKQFDKSIRSKKLKGYKLEVKNKSITKEDLKITKADIPELKKEFDAKIKATKEVLDRKIARGKKQEEFLQKKLRRKELQEHKRKEKLVQQAERKRIKLAKEAEKKRIRNEKRQEMLLKKAEQKKIHDQKRKEMLAQKAERDRINSEKREQKLFSKNQNKNIKKENQNIVVNENLKIVLFNKKIINSNLLPNLNSGDKDYETIEDLGKNDVDLLFKTNTNLVLIIPKDYDSFSNNISENQMTSKVVSGIRQVPNPEYRRLEMEIRNTEQKMMMAKREAEYYEAKLNNPYRQSSGIDWLDILSVGTETAAAISHQNKFYDLQSSLNNLVGSYSNTPMYLDKEMFSPYNYTVMNVKSEKNAIYDVIEYKNKNFFSSKIKIGEEKTFKVAYNINPQDKNYEQLIKKYHTPESIKNWEQTRIKEVSTDTLLVKLETAEKKQLRNVRDVYSNLKLKNKKKSWNIFGNKKDRKKRVAKLNESSNKFTVEDERFDSVVVVRAGNSLGSGFYISSNEVITNYHVIEKARSIYVVDRNKNKSSAVVIKKDMKRDLALLRTNSDGKPVNFFNGQIKQGAMVEALGHPKGRKFSLTKGWVSAIRKESSVYNVGSGENVLYIQTDAAINKGNSGGPLFMENKVVGVNTQGLSKKKTEGMNFAVHFSEVQDFLNN